MTIDVVYILRKKEYTLQKRIEKEMENLTYSLRSIDKHLRGVRNVYVIGNGVSHIINKSVIAIDKTNLFTQNRNEVIQTVKFIEENKAVTKFILMSENTFLTSDMDAFDVPYLYNGKLNEENVSVGITPKALENTYELLRYARLPLNNYEFNSPMLMDVNHLKKIFGYFNLAPFSEGVCLRSLYANFQSKRNSFFVPFVIDKEKSIKLDLNFAMSILEKRRMFTVNDSCYSVNIMQLLYKLYPNKSRWEL